MNDRGLQITVPLVFFDLETTELDIETARIVEIAAIKVLPTGGKKKLHERIRPGIHIPADATKIHGISDDDVKDCPLFEAVAQKIYDFFDGCDLSGFNIIRYDIPVLANNLKRVGLTLKLSEIAVVDTQRIFHMREPRDLSAAVSYYTDGFLVGAHSAMTDTEAAMNVLLGQLERYDDLPTDVRGLHDATREPGAVDIGGKLVRISEEICFAFGKHRHEPVWKCPGHYLEWVLGNVTLGSDAADIIRGVLSRRTTRRR